MPLHPAASALLPFTTHALKHMHTVPINNCATNKHAHPIYTQVVVVKSYECISRLRSMLGAERGAPTPSMLSYTLIQPFRCVGVCVK